MKHSIKAIPLILALTIPLSAFANKDVDVAKMLNLEGDRADQVEEIMENYHDQRDTIKKRAHDDIDALKEQKKNSLKAVLTDDELNQLEEMHKAKKAKHKKHGDCENWMDDDE